MVLEMHMDEYSAFSADIKRVRRMIEGNVDALRKVLDADFLRPNFVFTQVRRLAHSR